MLNTLFHHSDYEILNNLFIQNGIYFYNLKKPLI